MKKLMIVAMLLLLVGCGPSKWESLRQSELQNEVDINAYCYTEPINEEFCERAKQIEQSLADTRAEYVRQAHEACKRSWAQYERDVAGFDRKLARWEREYDRKLAEYDRKLTSYDRDKEREERNNERKKDRYERDLDRYERCEDRNQSSTYPSYCSRPSYPYPSTSFLFPPTKPYKSSKPSKPWEPNCTL